MAYDLNQNIGADCCCRRPTPVASVTICGRRALGFILDERWSVFIEAGFGGGDGPETRIAGGGVTWMATPAVQLDASLDFGRNDNALGLQGRIGISLYFD